MQQKVLVIGGYGSFGRKLCDRLSSKCHLIVCGRNMYAAKTLSQTLQNSCYDTIDIDDVSTIQNVFNSHQPSICLNVSGPFDYDNFNVAQQCIQHGIHYIDISDDRSFIYNISETLNKSAEENNIYVISGASTVPAVTNSVMNKYYNNHNIVKVYISPGYKTLRGIATVNSVLSYSGKHLIMNNNNYYGFMHQENVTISGLNKSKTRRLGIVNVADYDLLDSFKKYGYLEKYEVRGGVELKFIMYISQYLSWFVKKGFIKDLSKYSKLFLFASNWFNIFGTDDGGLKMEFIDSNNNIIDIFELIALDGTGPHIPVTPAIVLTEKLINNNMKIENKSFGAYPCIDFVTLEEIMSSLTEWTDRIFIYSAPDRIKQ